ncbi:MAG: RNA polymerase sporulation sigma factor SigE [Clostridia bacterium]|nr:RNA polymerase sporulation sigma factor SigE [Clostridia bacterium]
MIKFLVFFKKVKSKICSRLKNEVYYINGTENLPPPLEPDCEEALILDISNEKSRNILIEHNLRLVVYIAKRFENTGVGIEELISIGTLGLIKAISTFNNDKNIKLATYASRCIENEILMFIRKSSSKRREVSIDEPLSVDWDGNELLLSDILGAESDTVSKKMEDDEERKILRNAVRTLSDRERTIIEMRYGLSGKNELTQKEVADVLGISQSYISRIEKKVMVDLRRKIEEKI